MSKPPSPTGLLSLNEEGEIRDNSLVTLPVPIPLIFFHARNVNITLTDLKLWYFLLHLSWDDLLTHSKLGEWHTISESKLSSLYRKYTGTRNMERLWNSAKNLTDLRVEFQQVDYDGDRWYGISSMFSCRYKPPRARDGIFEYMFPAPLIPILQDPKIFARLRMLLMLRLKSKYSLALYQMVETVANMKKPVLICTVDQARKAMKIPDNKLRTWNSFYNTALRPAINEINETSTFFSGLNIVLEIEKSNKKVILLKFNVLKTQARRDFEQSIKASNQKKIESNLYKIVPQIPEYKIAEIAKRYVRHIDHNVLERQWRNKIAKEGKPDNALSSFAGYCRAVAKNSSRF